MSLFNSIITNRVIDTMNIKFIGFIIKLNFYISLHGLDMLRG